MKRRTDDYLSKPYNRCLHCDYRGTSCDGPRTSAMRLPRWCEFMRDMKDLQGLTNADIAERSQVSVKTVERLMALNSDQDIMRETARAIEDAIIGSSNQYPCYMAFMEAVPDSSKTVLETETEMAELRKNIARIHDSYNEELRIVREEAQKKIDYLKLENERKDRIIERLLK